MPAKRYKPRILRPTGHQLSPRKTVVIVTEGSKTEKEYFVLFFEILNRQLPASPLFKPIFPPRKRSSSAPKRVLNCMKKFLEFNGKEPNAIHEAWLVVDRDEWKDKQLSELGAWEQKRRNYRFALSNPKFEYWLLLHFEDGNAIKSRHDCSRRLKKHIPDYDKGIFGNSAYRKITWERIQNATRRARQRDDPPCEDLSRVPGCTTVYRLVESILKG